MIVIDFRSHWRVGLRRPCSLSGVLLAGTDVLSGVPMAIHPLCHQTRSASASALHSRVHSPVQSACSERVMLVAWRAFAGWLAGCALRSAAGASHSRAVRPGKDAGQDKRSRHSVARKVCLHVGVAQHAPDSGTVPRG